MDGPRQAAGRASRAALPRPAPPAAHPTGIRVVPRNSIIILAVRFIWRADADDGYNRTDALT